MAVTAGGKRQVEELRSGTSYLSQNELVLHFGLGSAARVEKVEIRWPSGATQILTNLAADQVVRIREAAGR